MKKLIIMFLLFSSLFLLIGSKTNASDITTSEKMDTTSTVNLPNPGIKPGNFFYKFDKFFENLSLKFTFNDEKRAEKLSRFAEERLAELNSIDSKTAQKYGDELFNEYGLDVEKANLYIQNLAADGKISNNKLAKIEALAQNSEMIQEKIQDKLQDRVSESVRTQVRNDIQNTKISMFSQFTDVDTIVQLHEDGYCYRDLLRLQAISELSLITIPDLLLIENSVITTEDNIKTVDIEIILQATNLTQEELQTKLNEYKITTKQLIQTKIKEVKSNAKQRMNEIRNQVKNQSGNSNHH